jgi:hypothetical protein
LERGGGSAATSGMKVLKKFSVKRVHAKKDGSSTRLEKKQSGMLPRYRFAPPTILEKMALAYSSSLPRLEYKGLPPSKVPEGAPTSLAPPSPGYRLTVMDEGVHASLVDVFGNRTYRFRIATALNMSSSGAGTVNSTIANTALASNAAWINLSAIFNEFFVVGFRVVWEPVSRYNYPLTGVVATSVSSLPLGCSQLQHAQPAYTSLALMTNNYGFKYTTTSDPFSFEWSNTESPGPGIVDNGAPTQSWCVVSDIAQYAGSVQFMSQSAPPGLPTSQVLGTFMVEWDILWRCRA